MSTLYIVDVETSSNPKGSGETHEVTNHQVNSKFLTGKWKSSISYAPSYPHFSLPSHSLSSFPSASSSCATVFLSPPPNLNPFHSTKVPYGTTVAAPSATLSVTPSAMLSSTSITLRTRHRTTSPPTRLVGLPKLMAQCKLLNFLTLFFVNSFFLLKSQLF